MNKPVTSSYYDLMPVTKTGGEGIIPSVLNALPMAVSKPFLEGKRLEIQEQIVLRAIESNEATREDIMKTIRELGAAGELTPELAQYLFAAYNQALIQLPF